MSVLDARAPLYREVATVEVATDRQCQPILDALGDGFDELVTILTPWGAAVRDAGGYLPTPMELYSIRTVVNLGDGVPPNYAVADQYYADNFAYKTITVDGSGIMAELEINNPTKYVCAYALVR